MSEDHQLRELRDALLRLHKSLLDVERADFEKMFGRLTSGELLQLVINHAQFAWLRRISELVAQIDGKLNGDEEAADIDSRELLGQARRLFNSPGDEDFTTKYQAALQAEPTVVLAHSEVMKLLRTEA
ncbi:MAG: hypothetical protein ACREBC_34875 [Pyrinomonadaceae bacterium]